MHFLCDTFRIIRQYFTKNIKICQEKIKVFEKDLIDGIAKSNFLIQPSEH